MEADDVDERSIELRFEPFQAMKVVTTDCYVIPDDWNLGKAVCEIMSSEWIAKLKRDLSTVDETADFMDRARHFVLPLGDGYLEVVAWAVRWTYAEKASGQPGA